MTVMDWSIIVSAAATVVIAAFTVVLACVGRRQAADAEILQRAYVSVEPLGIVTGTTGLLIGQVAFKNVGKLPATEFVPVVRKIEVHHAEWVAPILTDNDLPKTTPSLVPIGAEVPQGSGGITPEGVAQAKVSGDKYLYVYGRARFKDGFKRDRYVNFCHRYPWAMAASNGSISKDWARYHNDGNNAD